MTAYSPVQAALAERRLKWRLDVKVQSLRLIVVSVFLALGGWAGAAPAAASSANSQVCSSAPALTDASPSAAEGDHRVVTVATFTDSCFTGNDTYTSTITWSTSGDPVGGVTSSTGTVVVQAMDAAAGTANGYISGVPPYLESGTATNWTVSITRASGFAPTSSLTPRDQGVDDPDICGAVGRTVVPTEGLSFTGAVGAFEDLNTNATANDFTATIDWGDGTTSAGTISATSGLTFSCDDIAPVLSVRRRPAFVATPTPSQWLVSGTHTYAEEGPFVVNFSAADTTDNADTTPNEGGTPGQANVADAALGGSCKTSLSSTVNSAFSGPVASFTDADPQGAKADYSGNIDWGDGTTPTAATITGSGPGGEVSGSHTYTTPGTYTLTIKVFDSGGGHVTITCNTANGGAFGVLGIPKLPAAGAPGPAPAPAGALIAALMALVGSALWGLGRRSTDRARGV